MSARWEPTNRPGKLAMAQSWSSSFGTTFTGENAANRARWRVPANLEEQLSSLIEHIIVDEQRPAAQRTPVMSKTLTDRYTELTQVMRQIKRMCFTMPPLTERDFLALGLKVPDRTPTVVNVPTATPDVESSSAGHLQVRFHAQPSGGSVTDERADYGLKLKGCILPRGEVTIPISPCGIPYATEAPQHALDFKWDTFKRKSRFTIAFDSYDLGGLFYYCARYENSKGEAGPWSPIAFAVIS